LLQARRHLHDAHEKATGLGAQRLVGQPPGPQDVYQSCTLAGAAAGDRKEAARTTRQRFCSYDLRRSGSAHGVPDLEYV